MSNGPRIDGKLVDGVGRPRNRLESTVAATAWQKAFGAELRTRVVERGEPFAVAQADTPHEIFHAMDIPVVSKLRMDAPMCSHTWTWPGVIRM